MWFLALCAAAAPSPSAPVLARAGEVPEDRLYAQIQEVGGLVQGRYRRRRDAPYELFVLDDGTVVRWIHTQGKGSEDHLLDAAGRPLVTITREGGAPRSAVLHGVEERTVDLSGWAPVDVPGGRLDLPPGSTPREGGGLDAEVLGGHLAVWREQRTDPTGDAFLQGLLAGCGCALTDRATTWIDGHPAVRFGVEVGSDLAEVWALPLPDATLVLTWRVPSPTDPILAGLTGRILPALFDLTPNPGPR